LPKKNLAASLSQSFVWAGYFFRLFVAIFFLPFFCAQQVETIAQNLSLDLTTWYIPDLAPGFFDGPAEGLAASFCFFHQFDLIFTSDTINHQSPINKYGVVLAHNFPLVCIGKKANGEDLLVIDPEWRTILPSVQEKYARRIARFRAACHSLKKVYFFRYLDINYQQSKQLSDLLEALYPQLDFVLICVNNSSSLTPYWGLPRVKNYHYNTQAPSSIEEWRRIFTDASLI
jgi:hypothetical protein